MWQRPSIIPPIDSVEVHKYPCGCMITLVNDSIIDYHLLIHRYRVPMDTVLSIKWAMQIKKQCWSIPLYLERHLDLNNIKQAPVDAIKSLQLFQILTESQLGVKS